MLKSPTTDETVSAKKVTAKKHTFKLNANDKYFSLIFLGPSLLILTLFVFYPMLRTLYISMFLTNTLGNTTVFAGFSNYASLISSPDFINSLVVTLTYVLAVTFFTLSISLLLANLASKKLPGISVFRTLYSVTMGVSVSVAAIFWLFIFNPSTGFFALISNALKMTPINWLTDPQNAMWAVIITTVWMNLGFTFLILLGAIESVPQSLYEAANVEGASSRYQFFKITLPMISPTLFFVSTITIIGAFKSFGLIDLITKGGPTNATNMLVYRIYKDAFYSGNYAQASTEAIILTVIIAVFTLLQFKFLEKRVNY
ncbi:carbohydrate ABC transporter permease [Companilactobacillus sp.]|jgi:sn-glycerol 3-phosphate transport system permease protein|uniref:carbohydrate ABC transporter permease n=1 Tax=Companilactobacillus sp. TaxID=2767905 RepID=UPI0025C04D8C|nr:sugar ABC transporter permease [Companilactobacillus sp.]MCH4009078.1 sugar ABC transporter permease [Companilactobacillus sp.]MCH4050743.1 sugar ABC transporter permease [Companilactobacillus sp.]MCH4077020.1 sugar ABC transporter permease [Companilactobacillus sp.]MCH4125596.1 sugar ABC transporter permease [Companilactobacillus sp.]MCI1311305.1 sugar ABC transporter permease [Companilactobacillus sp.]